MDENELVERKPKIAVSVDMKINLGNYESAGGSCMLSGIDIGATEDDILAMINTAEMTFNMIRQELEIKLNEYRAELQSARKNGR